MSPTQSTGILVFFAATVVLSIAISIWQEKWLRQLNFRIPAAVCKHFALFILAIGAVLGLRGFIASDGLSVALLFAGAALLPFTLKRFGVQSGPLGLILLLLVVCQSKLFSEHLASSGLLATLLGIAVYKVVENFIFGLENTFEDVLPPFIWLTGQFWMSTTGTSSVVKILQENILLGCISLALLLKLAQKPYLNEDKSFVKRILLTALGGLGLLLMLMKILLVPKMAPLAALFAGGLFMTYMFEPLGQTEEKQAADPVRLLVMIGILTLVATRLFGTFGLLVVAPSTLVSIVSEGALLAGLFWIGRVLLQAFIVLYNSNITGVNLMHSYTSAALYAGILIILLLSLAIRDIENKWISATVLLAACILIPPGMIYFLHEEPNCSLLNAATATAISFGCLVPIVYKRQETSQQKNLVLLPVLMAAVSILFGQLVELGNQATAASRVQLAGFITASAAIFYLAFHLYNSIRSRRQPVDVSREQG